MAAQPALIHPGTMLTFADVERLLVEQYELICGVPGIAAAVRKYRNVVADTSPRTWQVAGVYAYQQEDVKLVLEALHLRTRDVCVVRVYRDRPLEILFARKSSGDLNLLALALGQAKEQFIMHLPANPIPVASFEPDTDLDIEVSLAYLPIPPPVTLEDIPD